MIKNLLTPEQLFDRYFLKWYDQNNIRKMKVKPDMMTYAKPGTEFIELQKNLLTEKGITAISKHINIMKEAALEDWKMFLDIGNPLNIDDIEKFDNYYNKKEVLNLINSSDPEDFSNEFLVTCCEFGVILGTNMINLNNELCWIYDHL
mgnify:CR=1 FL=1